MDKCMLTSKIMAHRGLSSLAPENTLSALKLVAEQGYSWVEIDAIACGDGTIVMWHDNSVDRCSDGSGAMSDHTAQSIAALDCGSWFSEAYAGEKMATIEEAILLLKALNLGLNLEIKLYDNTTECVVAPILELLKQHWTDFDKLIISSFDHSALEYCHKHAPDLKLGKIYEKIPTDWQAQLQGINAVSCHCSYKFLTQAQVSAVKGGGYEVYTYTPNDAERVAEHWQWGVDSMITDFPQRYAHIV